MDYSLTFYLAKLIGFSFALIGLSLIVRTENFQKTTKQISTNDAIMTLISIMPLVLGLAIVIGHNLWMTEWPVVITIIGWIILVCGVFRLFFHKALMKTMATYSTSKSLFQIIGIILLIVGLYLAYMGILG